MVVDMVMKSATGGLAERECPTFFPWRGQREGSTSGQGGAEHSENTLTMCYPMTLPAKGRAAPEAH
jgi:hypothetical protein